MDDKDMIETIHMAISSLERVRHQLEIQPQRHRMENKLKDLIKDMYWIMRNFDKPCM